MVTGLTMLRGVFLAGSLLRVRVARRPRVAFVAMPLKRAEAESWARHVFVGFWCVFEVVGMRPQEPGSFFLCLVGLFVQVGCVKDADFSWSPLFQIGLHENQKETHQIWVPLFGCVSQMRTLENWRRPCLREPTPQGRSKSYEPNQFKCRPSKIP